MRPGYVASAARAVAGSTAGTGSGSWSAGSARATSVPSYDATRSSSDRATAIATSSGGGWLSRTVVAAQSDGASAASAPEV